MDTSEWGGRKGGDKALAAFNRLDQSPDHLPASTICLSACITMSSSHKSQIPAHQQQIAIGIPVMSHQMPSYPLQQRKAPSGWTGGQKFLTSLSPWKDHDPFWIHKGLVTICLFEYQKGLARGPLTVSFYQAGVWWSIIKDPALVTLSGRWNWGFRGFVVVGAHLSVVNLDGGETVEKGERILFT